MPFYQSRGRIPKKRHTVFRKEDGTLYYEEHMSREGFSGAYSNLYHQAMPTRVKRVGEFVRVEQIALGGPHRPRHLKTAQISSSGDFVSARRLLFFNGDISIHKAHPTEEQGYFYRNGHFDELIYVQEGSGRVDTQFGTLSFGKGDYLVLPRGVISKPRFEFEKAQPKLLIFESARPIGIPKRYLNALGQLNEQTPFSERDLRTPELHAPSLEARHGEFHVRVKLQGGIQEYFYDSDPFDVVGWDGTHYPWALSISDFDPIVGRIHQPPPVHQTFEGQGFVICSFVSRPFDFHPDAIPAPYPHSNLDSDEVLFYSEGDFMSRSGIFQESITYHPMGLAHGPQPGKYEASIGKTATEECAVMLDTFRPLQMTSDAERIEDPSYALGWI